MKRSPMPPRKTPLRSVGSKGRERARAMRAVRDEVLARDKHRCQASLAVGCSGRAEHLHHIAPRSRGGTEDPGNLISLCHACHTAVHANPTMATRLGFLR